MRPHLAVFDSNDTKILDLIKTIGFSDTVSTWDGVTYPGICDLNEFNYTMSMVLGQQLNESVEVITTFARLTSAAQKKAPNEIHPDTVMSQYAMLQYLSPEWPDGAGTSFWEHKTEGRLMTEQIDEYRVRQDSCFREAWTEYFRVQGKEGRILFYDSRLFHCAEPVGGFGSGPEDGRIVLTSFFNIVS